MREDVSRKAGVYLVRGARLKFECSVDLIRTFTILQYSRALCKVRFRSPTCLFGAVWLERNTISAKIACIRDKSRKNVIYSHSMHNLTIRRCKS